MQIITPMMGYEPVNKKQILFAIEEPGQHFFGDCMIGIDWKNRVGNLGIVIGEKDAWGKGHGTRAMTLLVTYAFGALGMHRVELDVFASNARAMALYKKVGFTVEGTRRQGHFKHGKFIDVVHMGLLEQEWRARA